MTRSRNGSRTGGLASDSSPPSSSDTTPTGQLAAGGADNTPGEIVLSADFRQILVHSQVVDNSTGAVTLVKTGDDEVLMFYANTHTGGTYINDGNPRAIHSGGFASGAVHVAPRGQAHLDDYNDGGTYANDFYIAGIGGSEDENLVDQGALRLSRSDVIVSGTVTLTADAQITFHGAGWSGDPRPASITGKITGNHALILGGGNSSSYLHLSNSTNDWAGDTTLRTGTI